MFSGIAFGLKQAGIFSPETLFPQVRGYSKEVDEQNQIKARKIADMVLTGAGAADFITGIALLTIGILAMQGYFPHLSPLTPQFLLIGGIVYTTVFLPSGFAGLTLGITEAIKCCLPNNRC